MVPKNFDVTFKITEFDPDNDVLVVQYHSNILKKTIEEYPEINLGTRIIDLEKDVEEQIVEQCRGLILEAYKQENKDPIKEEAGISYIKNNFRKKVTKREITPEVVPSSFTKIKFL